MIYLSAAAAVGGATALALVPHDKNRAKRLLQRGGAATLFGLGLFGTMFSLVLG